MGDLRSVAWLGRRPATTGETSHNRGRFLVFFPVFLLFIFRRKILLVFTAREHKGRKRKILFLAFSALFCGESSWILWPMPASSTGKIHLFGKSCLAIQLTLFPLRNGCRLAAAWSCGLVIRCKYFCFNGLCDANQGGREADFGVLAADSVPSNFELVANHFACIGNWGF